MGLQTQLSENSLNVQSAYADFKVDVIKIAKDQFTNIICAADMA